MTNSYTYNIVVYENDDPNGIQLRELERKVVKYFKEKKANGPFIHGEGVNYTLRNRYDVTYEYVTPLLGGPMNLDFLVIGDAEKIKRAIDALKRIYPADNIIATKCGFKIEA